MANRHEQAARTKTFAKTVFTFLQENSEKIYAEGWTDFGFIRNGFSKAFKAEELRAAWSATCMGIGRKDKAGYVYDLVNWYFNFGPQGSNATSRFNFDS